MSGNVISENSNASDQPKSILRKGRRKFNVSVKIKENQDYSGCGLWIGGNKNEPAARPEPSTTEERKTPIESSQNQSNSPAPPDNKAPKSPPSKGPSNKRPFRPAKTMVLQPLRSESTEEELILFVLN